MASSRAARVPVLAGQVTKIADNPRASGYGDEGRLSWLVKNLTGTAPVFLDTTQDSSASSVAAGDGFQWDPADGPLTIELEPNERLYGITTVDQTVHAIPTGR